MKTKNDKSLSIIHNSDLTKRFQEAGKKKVFIDEFVNDFLCGFISHDTKLAYIKDLRLFFDYLKSGEVIITHPNQIESFHFQMYRDDMMKKGYASATVSRRLVAIRSFMKWSVAKGLIEYNCLDSVKLPKTKTETETIAFEDVEAVRMISSPDCTNHRGRTHRLAMVLLFNLGLRRNELVNIRLEHVYEERGHIVLRIHGKGDKTRLVPLSDFVQNEINRYINSIAADVANTQLLPNDYLLQASSKGRKNTAPIDGSTIYRIINRYAKRLGINKRVSPHSCRATVISHLLDTQGRSIRDVASFAGHTNISTTERYDKRRNILDHSAAYSVSYEDGVEGDEAG